MWTIPSPPTELHPSFWVYSLIQCLYIGSTQFFFTSLLRLVLQSSHAFTRFLSPPSSAAQFSSTINSHELEFGCRCWTANDLLGLLETVSCFILRAQTYDLLFLVNLTRARQTIINPYYSGEVSLLIFTFWTPWRWCWSEL